MKFVTFTKLWGKFPFFGKLILGINARLFSIFHRTLIPLWLQSSILLDRSGAILYKYKIGSGAILYKYKSKSKHTTSRQLQCVLSEHSHSKRV